MGNCFNLDEIRYTIYEIRKFFLLKITEYKLATCWVGHFIDDEIKAILDIPKDMNVEAFFPIGYPLKKPDKKRKIELDSV